MNLKRSNAFKKTARRLLCRVVVLSLGCLIVLVSEESRARVFSFDKESIAPYVRIRTGLSGMGTSSFSYQSASQYSGDSVDLMYGGEFGVYLQGGSLGLSLGILVHQFDPVLGGLAADSSGTRLFSVDAKGIAYGPSLSIDYQFSKLAMSRWQVIFGGGYQIAKIESEYTFTSAGQALAGGQTSANHTYDSNSPFAMLGLGTEFFMSGTTTMSIMLGYHYNFNREWKHSGGGQDFSGTFAAGDVVSFEDGTPKVIDGSYPFIQIGFQFYVETLR